jgi:HK97 family phage portal protein
MIVKSGGSDRQVKSILDQWPYPVIPPEFGLGLNGVAGDPFWPFMSMEQAMGLPALLGVLLRISTACGMLPQKVYEGDDQLNRRAATDSWQYDLLHDRPGEEHTPFTLRADIALGVAGAGYSCIRKYKVPDRTVPGGQRVAELLPLDSRLVKPKRVNGRLVFEDRTEGELVTRDRSEIIYVRAPASNGGVEGLAPITLTRMGISTGLKRQIFEGGYYDKSAEPRVVLAFPEQMQPDQAEEWRELWNDQHQGLANMHGTSVIGGGATVSTIPVSLADAMFVQATNQTADQIGFIYGMPKVFMNTVERPTITDNDWRYFVTFGLGWIMAAVDQAFTADRDLFPAGAGRMHVETITDALLKPDIQTRYGAYLVARQAGWLTSNEIRALENYPPVPGGDVLQITPVGAGVDNTGTSANEAAAKALDLILDDFKDATPEQRQILERISQRARELAPIGTA